MEPRPNRLAYDLRGFKRVARNLGDLFSSLKNFQLYRRSPKPQRVLVEAAHLHRTKSIDAALTYLRSNALPSQLMVDNLFLANDAKDDRTWQANVNAYLAQYDITPVELAEGNQKRFYRLAARVCNRVQDGPLISVITTTFNAQRTVEQAISSILNQTWQNIELIIVDDASTDHTFGQLNKLAAADCRVRIFRNGATLVRMSRRIWGSP